MGGALLGPLGPPAQFGNEIVFGRELAVIRRLDHGEQALRLVLPRGLQSRLLSATLSKVYGKVGAIFTTRHHCRILPRHACKVGHATHVGKPYEGTAIAGNARNLAALYPGAQCALRHAGKVYGKVYGKVVALVGAAVHGLGAGGSVAASRAAYAVLTRPASP